MLRTHVRYGWFDWLLSFGELLAPLVEPLLSVPTAAITPADERPSYRPSVSAEPEPPVAAAEVAPAEPLFVLVQKGKVKRYVPAADGVEGQRFRKAVVNGRTKYTPVGG